MKKTSVLVTVLALAAFGAQAATTVSTSAWKIGKELKDVPKGEEILVVVSDYSPDLSAVSEAIRGYSATVDLRRCKGLSYIPEKAFYLNDSLKEVRLPETVKEIGDKAFLGTSLTSVEFPRASIGSFAFARTEISDVQISGGTDKIGTGAFSETPTVRSFSVDADNATFKSSNGVLFDREGKTLICYPAAKEGSEYEVPEGVTAISASAFANNRSLSKIILPSTLKRIGGYAFKGCSSLKEVEIPESVTLLGQNAFEGTAIEKIDIPAGVKDVGKNPFNGCSSLRAINVADGNKSAKSVDGILFSADGSTILRYPAGREGSEYAVPKDTTEVAPYAFEGTNLSSIDVSQARTVGKFAFKDCASLRSVSFGDRTEKIGHHAFQGTEGVQGIPAYYRGDKDSFPPEED